MKECRSRHGRHLVAVIGGLALALAMLLPAGALAAPVAQTGTDGFTPVSDERGIFTVEVPADWQDVDETDWELDDAVVGIRLDVSPDLAAFYDDWTVPGVIVRYSETLDEEMTAAELLEDYFDLSSSCDAGDRDALEDGDFLAEYQFWNNCQDTGTNVYISVLTPAEEQNYFVVLELYANADDIDTIDHVLSNLTVNLITGDVLSGEQGTQDETSGGATEVTISADSPLFDLVNIARLDYEYVEAAGPAVTTLLPADYSEIESQVWENEDGEFLGYTFTAAPNLQDFRDTWETPGIIVQSATGLGEAFDPDEMLASESLAENCEYDDRYEETHEIGDLTYNVVYDAYLNCADTTSSYYYGMAETDPLDQIVFFDFLAVDDADLDAFDVFLSTFAVDPALAVPPGGDQPDKDETAAIDYAPVVDDSGTISLDVPDTWTDVVSEDWDLGDGPVGVALTAAPDAQGFNDQWDVPGVFVGVSDEVAEAFDVDGVLDAFDFSDGCDRGERVEIVTANLGGKYDIWENCGGIDGSMFYVLAALPTAADSPMVLLYAGLPTAADQPVFSRLLDSLAVTGAIAPAAAAEDEVTELRAPIATVVVDTLNVRSGPGTSFSRVSQVKRGAELAVAGQVNNCAWLRITTADGVEGWVSGSDQYVSLDARCAEIPEVEAPSAPAGGATGGGTGGGTASGGNAAAGGSGGAGGLDPTKGCLVFQNQLGPELTITITNKDSGKGETFKVGPNAEQTKCVAPGKYALTIDAPPPWSTINDDLTLQAGDAYLYPVRGE